MNIYLLIKNNREENFRQHDDFDEKKGYYQETRLKLNSVLDRDPKNYSDLPSFPKLSNFAILRTYFAVHRTCQIFPYFVNLVTFLTKLRNMIRTKSTYFHLCRKIDHAHNQFIFTYVEKYNMHKINLFLQKAKNKSFHSRLIRNERSILRNIFNS